MPQTYPLSADQVEHFHTHGYVHLPDVLTQEEVAHLEETYDRFMRGEVSGMRRDICDNY